MSDRDIIGTVSNEPSIKGEFTPELVIKGAMEARFPANVYVVSPVVLDRTGGNYTFSIDMSEIIANLPPSGVASVFGRTGDVTAQSGDYTFSQIGSTPTTLSGYGITDAQPLDSDLTALASNNTNGLWARTGAGTGAARTITGTANAISVSNGDGVSGNPTLSISTDAALPGNPTTTTQAVDNNTTRVATTAFFIGQAASATPLGNAATAAVGTSTRFARADHVHPGREQLTANRTYYVRTDGSNSNNGLANTSGGAFLTIQKAIDIVAALDISIYNVTINVADGTYTGTVVVTGPWIGSGTVTLTGNTGTPANCIINTTNCISATTQGRLNVAGFKLTSSGIGLYASTGSSITTTGAMEFGANSSYCAYADNGGVVRIGSAFTISGAGGYAALGAQSFGIINVAGIALTVSGTPAFASSFASAAVGGLIVANSFTFSGAGATGPRYSATAAGGIFTAGGGANVFPGNSAGSATSPGWYN